MPIDLKSLKGHRKAFIKGMFLASMISFTQTTSKLSETVDQLAKSTSALRQAILQHNLETSANQGEKITKRAQEFSEKIERDLLP